MPITRVFSPRQGEAREQAGLGSARRGRVHDHVGAMALVDHLDDAVCQPGGAHGRGGAQRNHERLLTSFQERRGECGHLRIPILAPARSEGLRQKDHRAECCR
jgi:hypothetical protein